jgi:hypothetical protein
LKWYEEEGNEAIAEINCADNLDCDAALTAAGDRIDARWENVWIAWQLLTVARDTYETTLEAGGKPDAMALEQAYCGLLTTIPKEYKERLTLLSVRCP